jgi:hypothetical protein
MGIASGIASRWKEDLWCTGKGVGVFVGVFSMWKEDLWCAEKGVGVISTHGAEPPLRTDGVQIGVKSLVFADSTQAILGARVGLTFFDGLVYGA